MPNPIRNNDLTADYIFLMDRLDPRRVGDSPGVNFPIADHTPESAGWQVVNARSMLLTNSDLPSHAINQLLGIVADPSLEYRLDVLDLVNSF